MALIMKEEGIPNTIPNGAIYINPNIIWSIK